MVVICEYDNANRKNNRLQIFNVDEGKPINSLLQGQIQPLGVAVTRDQQSVVVTDCKEKRVKIVSLATGSVVAEIGKGQFGWPYGVAVNSKGHIIVSDAFNDSVAVFSAEGKKIRTFGSTGSHPEQFRNPYHVAVDSRDKIYVSDCGNNCVKVG
ncbi:hypothetical protein HELRODRAFT_86707 [Helobdella robusta]|uniref:SMP-30/Gluconolactonase/LRE-like region domain-containing protein n=1 Tax=Helobdella robusta TaxID=6412 RepID=T1G6F8_HELRO|nr:hypothetical protein HELRODRAFT_86707 [Helobdella robusta]ESN95460.1 hypothetical protein HELRODRAFT_86707 [Helobdella robusta]